MQPLSLFSRAVALVAVVTISLLGEEQLSRPDSNLNQLLAALKSPLNKGEAYDRAADELLKLGTNALPLILQKVRSVDAMAITNPALAGELKQELQAAFQVLGSNAQPILAELIRDFQSGRCLGNAPDAIARIGGEDAGRVLIAALTNKEPTIRACGASVIEFLAADERIARDAVRPLLKLLKDDSVVPKTVAATTLGTLGRDPEVVVPALLELAETDPDPAVRLGAISAIRHFRGTGTFAKTRLQAIARKDAVAHVRMFAEKVANEF